MSIPSEAGGNPALGALIIFIGFMFILVAVWAQFGEWITRLYTKHFNTTPAPTVSQAWEEKTTTDIQKLADRVTNLETKLRADLAGVDAGKKKPGGKRQAHG